MNDDTLWPHDKILHAWWAEPGRVLAGEYPGSRTPERAAKKIGLLVDAGIGAIVDLTSAGDGLTPYVRHLRALQQQTGRDVRYLSRPIPDMRGLNHTGYDLLLEDIAAEIADERIVYIHCWKGIGRTGTVIGCRLVDSGLDYPATIRRIAELRAGTRKGHIGSPQSAAQHQLLLERSRRRGVSLPSGGTSDSAIKDGRKI